MILEVSSFIAISWFPPAMDAKTEFNDVAP